MTIPLGLVVTLVCMLGGFAAMGGKLGVIWQPWEYVIILGASIGTFIVANPMKTIKDSGVGCIEALKNAVPKKEDYLVVLTCLFSLIRELKSKYQLTVLMAEQNFNQAIRIADAGYVIVHGKIAFQGKSADELNNNDLIRKFYLGLCHAPRMRGIQ